MNREKGEFGGFKEGVEHFNFAIDPELVALTKSIGASMGEVYLELLRSVLVELDKTLSETGGSVRAVSQYLWTRRKFWISIDQSSLRGSA